jgi:hypothetical protein
MPKSQKFPNQASLVAYIHGANYMHKASNMHNEGA